MNRLKDLALKALRCFIDHQEALARALARPGRDQTPAHGQLINPRLRHRVAAGGRDDAAVGRFARMAEHAVAKNQRDIVQL